MDPFAAIGAVTDYVNNSGGDPKLKGGVFSAFDKDAKLKDVYPSVERVRALAHGATLRHGGELRAISEHPLAAFSSDEEAKAEKAAEGYKKLYHQSAEDEPAAELAGGIMSGRQIAPFGKSALARLATGTGESAALSAATGDTGLSLKQRLGLGAVAGMGGGLLGEALGRLTNKGAQMVRDAEANNAAKEWSLASKAGRKTTSALGGKTAAILNDARATAEIMKNELGVFSPEEIAQAKAKMSDPKYLELVRNAGRQHLANSTERLAGQLQTARNAYETARKGMTPEAIEAASEASMAHPIKTEVLPRVGKYAERLGPSVLGSAFGPAGSFAGSMVGSTIGSPGTSTNKMLKSPGLRKLLGNILAKSAGGINKIAPGPSNAGIISQWLARQGEE